MLSSGCSLYKIIFYTEIWTRKVDLHSIFMNETSGQNTQINFSCQNVSVGSIFLNRNVSDVFLHHVENLPVLP